MATDQEKMQALTELLGDKDLVQKFVTQTKATEKAAEEAGVAYKETEEAEETDKAMGKKVTCKACGSKVSYKAAGVIKCPECGADIEVPEDPTAKKEVVYVGDLTPEELTTLVKTTVKELLTESFTTQAIATKEAQDGIAAKLTILEGQLETTVKELHIVRAGLKNLLGLQPSGYRSTTDPATVIAQAQKEEGNTGNPVNDFLVGFLGNTKTLPNS